MGREAYLDRIAFGRSAFEPAQSSTHSTEYVQLESSQSELPQSYQEATANNYVQLYDERGNPTNPRSHDYEKKLRGAQNDVLASVGVVARQKLPAEGLPGSYEERLDLLDAEDTTGNALALIATLTENLCTWWVGTMRDRILTFHYPTAIPLSQIIQYERAISGASLIHAGFTSRLFSTMSIQAVSYLAFVYQPIDRLLYATRATAKTRSLYRRSKSTMKAGLRLVLEVFFFPFSCHASLQRLGLVPATPLLPSWDTLKPWSSSSPLWPFSSRYNASTSFVGLATATAISPVILVCAEHFFERWVYGCIHEAVESSIIRPDNTDMQSRDDGDKDRAATILGLKRQSPPLVRAMINRVLTVLGWGSPFAVGKPTGELVIEIGGTQVTNVTSLELPISRAPTAPVDDTSSTNVITIPIDVVEEMIRPTTPPTPAGSALEQEDNDPRIRITSREGVVEMEVRLPPRILSSHTEVAEEIDSSPARRAAVSRAEAPGSRSQPYHRVTQLSSEPAQMVSSIVKAQLISLAMIPFKVVTLRLIATHYMAGQGGHADPSLVIRPLFDLDNLSWQSVGVQVSRVALCGALELSIDLGLWGLQYLTITKFGKKVFGWGTL